MKGTPFVHWNNRPASRSRFFTVAVETGVKWPQTFEINSGASCFHWSSLRCFYKLIYKILIIYASDINHQDVVVYWLCSTLLQSLLRSDILCSKQIIIQYWQWWCHGLFWNEVCLTWWLRVLNIFKVLETMCGQRQALQV